MSLFKNKIIRCNKDSYITELFIALDQSEWHFVLDFFSFGENEKVTTSSKFEEFSALGRADDFNKWVNYYFAIGEFYSLRDEVGYFERFDFYKSLIKEIAQHFYYDERGNEELYDSQEYSLCKFTYKNHLLIFEDLKVLLPLTDYQYAIEMLETYQRANTLVYESSLCEDIEEVIVSFKACIEEAQRKQYVSKPFRHYCNGYRILFTSNTDGTPTSRDYQFRLSQKSFISNEEIGYDNELLSFKVESDRELLINEMNRYYDPDSKGRLENHQRDLYPGEEYLF